MIPRVIEGSIGRLSVNPLELDPEIIYAQDEDGYLPIRKAARGKSLELIDLLLKHDPRTASMRTTGTIVRLPLHIACNRGKHLDSSTSI